MSKQVKPKIVIAWSGETRTHTMETFNKIHEFFSGMFDVSHVGHTWNHCEVPESVMAGRFSTFIQTDQQEIAEYIKGNSIRIPHTTGNVWENAPEYRWNNDDEYWKVHGDIARHVYGQVWSATLAGNNPQDPLRLKIDQPYSAVIRVRWDLAVVNRLDFRHAGPKDHVQMEENNVDFLKDNLARKILSTIDINEGRSNERGNGMPHMLTTAFSHWNAPNTSFTEDSPSEYCSGREPWHSGEFWIDDSFFVNILTGDCRNTSFIYNPDFTPARILDRALTMPMSKDTPNSHTLWNIILLTSNQTISASLPPGVLSIARTPNQTANVPYYMKHYDFH